MFFPELKIRSLYRACSLLGIKNSRLDKLFNRVLGYVSGPMDLDEVQSMSPKTKKKLQDVFIVLETEINDDIAHLEKRIAALKNTLRETAEKFKAIV